jgi:hypothetical protein
MSKAPRKQRAHRTARIAPDEGWDHDRFVAHIEGRQSVVEFAPDGFATVEEAVEWARERAPVVIVRLPDEHFVRSAGERAPRGDPQMPRWPPEPGEQVPEAPIPPALLVELHPDKHVTEYEPEAYAPQLDVVEHARRALIDSGFEVRVLPRSEPDKATIERRWRRAGRPEDFTWMVTTSLAFELVISADVDDITKLEPRAAEAVEPAMQDVLGYKPWRTRDEANKGRWGVTVKPHWPAWHATQAARSASDR